MASLRGLALVVGACIPLLAHANAGIGYFSLAIPLVILALAPAVFIEALVLRFPLKLPYRRALSLSWWANLRSTLWGLFLGIAADFLLVSTSGSAGPEPTRAVAFVALVPFFLLSWWIEARAVKRLAAELDRGRVVWVVGVANAVTYAAMAAGAAAMYPKEGSYQVRPQVAEALAVGAATRVLVAEFFANNQRLPKDAAELGYRDPGGSRFRVDVLPQGRIEVWILQKESKVQGKRLKLTPRVSADGKTLDWSCGSDDIEPRYLPSACRAP